MSTNVYQIVGATLKGASQAHLEDIASHGIHNTCNDFHGDSDAEYAAFSAEFETQAKAALAALEAERLVEFRAT